MYNKIVVPLDGSELAEKSLHYAAQLTAKSGADLILLHVCGPEECHCDAERCWVEPMHRAYIEHAAEMVRGHLQNLGAKSVKVIPVIRCGYPASEVLRYVDGNDFSLIAMTTHGCSGITQWIMGSVTYKVYRSSKVAVRLVRAFTPHEERVPEWPEKTYWFSWTALNEQSRCYPMSSTMPT